MYEKIQSNCKGQWHHHGDDTVCRKFNVRIQASAAAVWCKQCGFATNGAALMRFDEIAPIKPLSPEQARLKSMKDRVNRDQETVKAERARQKIKSAQNTLSNLGKPNVST